MHFEKKYHTKRLMLWVLCFSVTFTYGTLTYGTLKYDTLTYGTLKYDTLKYYTLKYNTFTYCTLNYGTLKHGTLMYCSLNYGTLKYGTLKQGTLMYGTSRSLTSLNSPEGTRNTSCLMKTAALYQSLLEGVLLHVSRTRSQKYSTTYSVMVFLAEL